MNKRLGSYLAGLLEGDGSFVVPKTIRDEKQRLRYAKIKVAFHIKDKPLADLLKNQFGGNFEIHKNYLVWTISDLSSLILVSDIVNGFLRTPKIADFYNLIDYINWRKGEPVLDKLKTDTSPIESNAWFAGFSDADSNFNIIVSEKKNKKKRIQIQYRLEIKHFHNSCYKDSLINHSFYDVCEKIANFLKGGFYFRSRPTHHCGLIVTSHSFTSHARLIEYFEKFPLFSSKFLDYCDWKRVYELQCHKLHLTPAGIQTSLNTKKNLHSTRLSFSWFHLKKFPFQKI